MKIITSALLLFTVVLLSGCKKDKPDEVQASVSFKVNGVLKQASGDTKVTGAHYSSEKTFQLLGNLDNKQGISLMLQDYKGVGDYDVETDVALVSYVTNLDAGLSGTEFGSTGTVKVTSATNKVVKGTFEFVVRDPVTNAVVYTVTEGKFESKIVVM